MSLERAEICRDSIRCANENARLWALGNGLATTTLITYLASELGAKGVVVSLILAAPTMAGLLRQLAPWLIEWVGSRKVFCLVCYAASAAALFALPIAAAPEVLPRNWSLAALVSLWCLYQLLEYLGTVALWSWLGDSVPARLRGRFFGAREGWLSVGRLAGMLLGGLFAYAWPEWMSRETLWQAYAFLGLCGALVMLGALGPLMNMAAREERNMPAARFSLRAMLQTLALPWSDSHFRRLVGYGCWLGGVNGLLQASQFFYSKNVLLLSLLTALALRSWTEVGQTLVSPTLGRWIDAVGSRRVMLASQLVVAQAMLFFLFATPSTWWLMIGAWTMFIAYAGLNIGIPNLLLAIAPQGNDKNNYIASYYAWAGLAYGLGSLVGGQCYDWAAKQRWQITWGDVRLDHFAIIFVIGLILRLLGAVWIARLPDRFGSPKIQASS